MYLKGSQKEKEWLEPAEVKARMALNSRILNLRQAN